MIYMMLYYNKLYFLKKWKKDIQMLMVKKKEQDRV